MSPHRLEHTVFKKCKNFFKILNPFHFLLMNLVKLNQIVLVIKFFRSITIQIWFNLRIRNLIYVRVASFNSAYFVYVVRSSIVTSFLISS